MADIRTAGPADIDLTDGSPLRPWNGRESGLARERVLGAKLALAWLDVLALVVIAIGLGLVLFDNPLHIGRNSELDEAAAALVLLGLMAPPVWSRLGLYRLSGGGWPLHSAARRAVVGAGALLMGVFALVVVFKAHDVSRVYLACFAVATAYWLVLSRVAASRLLLRWRSGGRGVSRVLIIGDGLGAERFTATLRAHPELGLEPIGFIGGKSDGEMERLGELEELRRILVDEVIDEVVICLPFERWASIRDCAQIAQEQGKTVRIPLWMVEELSSRNRVDEVGGVPLLSLVSTPDDVIKNGVKRAVDIVGALVGLTVFALPWLIAAFRIKRTDGGPVLFRQTRVGLHGRHFSLYKLRTMCVDAEDRLAEVAHLNEREGHAFKAADDPRVTEVGRWLRRTSLDEVPQFLNVLKGDMSLVGPRPPVPREVRLYDPRHRRRLSVKPGITGLWQISGRGESSFESWVELDLRYIDTWTPMSDVKIIAQTIPAVLRGTGV